MSTYLLAALFVLHWSNPAIAQAEDLSTQLMKATFKLGTDQSMATGFVLAPPLAAAGKKDSLLLVTAAHVLETIKTDEALLYFRKQEAPGVYKKMPVKIAVRKSGKPVWVKHPAADVAAMRVVPPGGLDIPRLPLDLLASDADLKRYAVHPGDNLLCLGYPHRFEANAGGFAVLRNGPIASYPMTPAKTIKTFLVSMNTFEGDSGGPIYLAEPLRLCPGNKEPVEARLILGLVLGQHFIDENVRTIYETRKSRHRLGFAIVAPAVYIRETIDRLPPAE